MKRGGSEAFAQVRQIVAVAGVVLEFVGLSAFGAVSAFPHGEVGEIAQAEVGQRDPAFWTVGVPSNVPQQAKFKHAPVVPQQREEPR